MNLLNKAGFQSFGIIWKKYNFAIYTACKADWLYFAFFISLQDSSPLTTFGE